MEHGRPARSRLPSPPGGERLGIWSAGAPPAAGSPRRSVVKSTMSVAHTWGTTDEERALAYPCDRHIAAPRDELYRGVTVDAPAAVVFRWLCQLRAAPYSYDWIDNFGRRSPQQLTPGLETLAAGQRVMTIFELVEFEQDRSITIRIAQDGRSERVFGSLAGTYMAVGRPEGGTRLLGKVSMHRERGLVPRVRQLILPWGDLVMMRRQLLNLKRLAERDARQRL